MHRHTFRQDAVLDKTDHTVLRILLKLSWHNPVFPIYSNGTKPRTLQKQRIENDKILTKLEVSVAHQGEAGADVIYTFPDSGTQIWMDMTTEKAWANHYRKYGSVERVPESMHKATYQSDGNSGFMDFRGRVK